MAPTDSRRRALLLVAALLVALPACGSSGGSDDAAGTDVTTTAVHRTTTTEPDEPTKADLEGLLPAANDIGAEWAVDDSAETEDTSPDPTDKAIEKQCPELAALKEDDKKGDEAVRTFTDGDARQLEVSLTPGADDLTQEKFDATVKAINGCGDIVFEDGAATTTMTFHAQASDDYGDLGAYLSADVKVEAAGLPQPVTLSVYGLVFRIGSVGVSITGTDGLNEDTLEVQPFDTALIRTQAERLQAAVDSLVHS